MFSGLFLRGGWGLNVNNQSVCTFQSRCDCWGFVLINVFEAKGMFGLVKVRVVFSTLVRLINSKQSFLCRIFTWETYIAS